jgi:cytochrome bd-I ubiquinol oxidase subunit X
MWYFAWILGTGLAVTFGIVNALWHEINQETQQGGCKNACGKH